MTEIGAKPEADRGKTRSLCVRGAGFQSKGCSRGVDGSLIL